MCNAERRNRRGHFLPERLLEVFIRKEILYIVLKESQKLREDCSYLILSYQWGKASENYQLDQGTFYAMHHGIELILLSQTYQDAAKLALERGINYLWIDSLCIVQSSEDDKGDQVDEKCDIYAHAELNIVANDSKLGHGGLCRKRNPAAVVPCLIRASWIKFKPGELVCYDPKRSENRVTKGAVNRRARVLQECFLCMANVHFTKDEIFWECRCLKASDFPKAFRILHPTISHGRLLLSLDKMNLNGRSGDSQRSSKLTRGVI